MIRQTLISLSAVATLVGGSLLSSSAVAGISVKTCQEAGIGLETLSLPLNRNVASFTCSGNITLFNVDSGTSPRCPKGLVILSGGERPHDENVCYYIGCFQNVDVTHVRSSFGPGENTISFLIPYVPASSPHYAEESAPRNLSLVFDLDSKQVVRAKQAHEFERP